MIIKDIEKQRKNMMMKKMMTNRPKPKRNRFKQMKCVKGKLKFRFNIKKIKGKSKELPSLAKRLIVIRNSLTKTSYKIGAVDSDSDDDILSKSFGYIY